MKKVAINIEFNGKNVTSNYSEFTDEEIKTLQQFCETAVSGKISYLKIESENKEYYFPKQIIEQSVISLVYGS